MRKLIPQVLEVSKAESTVRLVLGVDADIEYFRGHFDGFPILPGVALISWVSHFAAKYLGVNEASKGLDAVKFLKPIMPASQIHLEIEFVKEKSALHFVCSNDVEKVASGRLLLGAHERI